MADVELRIWINEQGKVSVTGPLANKGLCYQLLELGRDVIKDHSDKLAKSGGIVTAQPGDLPRG